MTETEPADAVAMGAFEGDELIAVGLVGAEGYPGQWRVRGMAATPAARGRGAGTAVLDALLEHARAQGATEVWASIRTPAQALYERAGFSVDSGVFEIPHIGPHVIMRVKFGASR
jgi:ribosomal protein S18 acetylase RimI-like enzyme